MESTTWTVMYRIFNHIPVCHPSRNNSSLCQADVYTGHTRHQLINLTPCYLHVYLHLQLSNHGYEHLYEHSMSLATNLHWNVNAHFNVVNKLRPQVPVKHVYKITKQYYMRSNDEYQFMFSSSYRRLFTMRKGAYHMKALLVFIFSNLRQVLMT